MEDEKPIVVIDNGGCSIKAGIAGDDHPSVVVPNAVGLEEFSSLSDETTFQKYLEAYKREDFKVSHPIKNGTITNWEDMETIWSHVVHNHLHVIPEQSGILVTEPIGNSKPARENMAEILLEKFNFSAISIATSPILPMYAAGRTTGIVLDVGDGITQVVPVWGGYPITDAMKRVDYGGRDVTQLLFKEQCNRQNLYTDKTKTPPEVSRLIKEQTCHVVLDYDQTIAKGRSPCSTEFELPNGEKIKIGDEAFSCPEYLFNPSRFEETESNKLGLHLLVYKSIMKTNIDVRKDLYANIVLSGGSTLFPGFVDRLEKELRELAPPSVKIKIVAHPGRKYFTWIGGSVMASLTSFPNTLITKESWEDGSGKKAIGKLQS